jgi:hypothetical protein
MKIRLLRAATKTFSAMVVMEKEATKWSRSMAVVLLLLVMDVPRP